MLIGAHKLVANLVEELRVKVETLARKWLTLIYSLYLFTTHREVYNFILISTLHPKPQTQRASAYEALS